MKQLTIVLLAFLLIASAAFSVSAQVPGTPNTCLALNDYDKDPNIVALWREDMFGFFITDDFVAVGKASGPRLTCGEENGFNFAWDGYVEAVSMFNSTGPIEAHQLMKRDAAKLEYRAGVEGNR